MKGRELVVEPAADGEVSLTLALGGEGASVKPDEVLREIFGEGAAAMRLTREELLVEHGGSLVDPMLAASPT